MGKGYNNFMSKKAFHPGSQANQKRVHEAEAKAAAKQKHDEETLAQYLREQELLDQKSLVSKQSKEKLSLNFMYEAPPGVEKPKQSDKVEFCGTDGKTVATGSKSDQICLEWKRSRPVKKSTQDTRQEIKSEGAVKQEPQQSKDIKTEPSTKRIKSER